MKGEGWIVLIAIALIVGGIWWEVASWGECLGTNSWWYCLRLLGK